MSEEKRVAGWFINEANGDRYSALYKTRQEAEEDLDEYDEADVDRCQPALGCRFEDGTQTFEV